MDAILRRRRTEHAKAVRRKYGDVGGHCKFRDAMWYPATDGCCNAITTFEKDNYLLVWK